MKKRRINLTRSPQYRDNDTIVGRFVPNLVQMRFLKLRKKLLGGPPCRKLIFKGSGVIHRDKIKCFGYSRDCRFLGKFSDDIY